MTTKYQRQQNATRQREFKKRHAAAGRSRSAFWVTPQEEQQLKKVLREMRGQQ